MDTDEELPPGSPREAVGAKRRNNAAKAAADYA
jgi:hypothetical protein